MNSWQRTDLANKQKSIRNIRNAMFTDFSVKFPVFNLFLAWHSDWQSSVSLSLGDQEDHLDRTSDASSPCAGRQRCFSPKNQVDLRIRCVCEACEGCFKFGHLCKESVLNPMWNRPLCCDVVSVIVWHAASFCFRILEQSAFLWYFLCVSHVKEEAIFRSSSELLIIILQICKQILKVEAVKSKHSLHQSQPS